MKLSKVTRVLDKFDIDHEELANFKIDALDINRVPNTKFTPNRNPVKCQVSILDKNGNVSPLSEHEPTARKITDNTLAVHVEQLFRNGDKESYQRMLLIK